MQISTKNINYLKNSNNKLNFSNFEKFNSVLSFLELPFFFDNDSNKFYRFEGSIYNFNYEITYRNFSVDLNLGLKVKTKMLMSLFMQLPSSRSKVLSKISPKTSFLLKDGFFKPNLSSTNFKIDSTLDKFSQGSLYKKLFNISLELSDTSINLLAPRHKFNRAVELNMFDLDTFVSTINANWVDINNLDTAFYKNSVRSLTVVNDNLRTFSFLVSSLDRFKILHTQYFNKYLYFKKVKLFIRTTRINSLFSLVKNKFYYLFIYDSIIKTTDNFLIKNLNYIYIYNYIVKFLLFIIYNYKTFNVNYVFIVKYLKYISLFISSSVFLESFALKTLTSRSNFVLKQTILKFLKQFIILFENSDKTFLNQRNNNPFNFFSIKRKGKLKRLNVTNLLPFNYSKMDFLKIKKCKHVHSLHRQPSILFSAYSRLGYTVTSIAHMTMFQNLNVYNYAEKSVTNYYSFLKVFSDFILSFFKRNFIGSILVNNYYNPKHLLFRYFSNVKLFFPLLFKRWVFSMYGSNISNLSVVSNYLNYFLLTKKVKTKRNKKLKKNFLNNTLTNRSKMLSLKNSKIYAIRSRSYSTLAHYGDFKNIVNLFSEKLFTNINYSNYNIFLVNLNAILNFNNFGQSIYFFYLLFCLSLNVKVINKVYFSKSSLFVIDYRLLAFFELLKCKINFFIFTKSLTLPFLRFTDFNIKIDFYTFIILNRFVEYFRCFKYNEYLSYNNINNLNIYNHFSTVTEEFYYLPSFFEFKRSLFFNKYLIFKIYDTPYSDNKMIVDDFSFFLNIPFFKFFSIMVSVKKTLNIFFNYFYCFIVFNIYYFCYKGLFYSNRVLQFTDVVSFDQLSLFLWKKALFPEITSFISRKYLQQSFLNDSTVLNYNIINNFFSSKSKVTFFSNILNFLLIDYIDKLILSKLLESQSYSSLIFLEFLRIGINRSYLLFINLSLTAGAFSFNILFLKRKLDFFIWSIYNFAFILNYNSVYLNDINLFINKLTVDNFINNNFYKFSKFILLCEKSLNISNFFFMYTVLRDYILKLLSRLFAFSYFYHLYFIYIFLNFLKFIQFSKIKLIFTKLKYYKVFDVFYNPKFNFLI